MFYGCALRPRAAQGREAAGFSRDVGIKRQMIRVSQPFGLETCRRAQVESLMAERPQPFYDPNYPVHFNCVMKTLAQTWHARVKFYGSRSLSAKVTIACYDHIAPGRACYKC